MTESSLQTRLRVAASVAEIGSHVAWERLVNPRPKRATSVPPSTEAFTTEWLSEVLCRGVPVAKVSSIELGQASSGSSDRRAFRVTYNEAGQAAQLPTHLFNKCSKGFFTRLMMQQCGTLENETAFYSRIRPELSIETPRVYYVALDPRSRRSTIILEDIFHTRRARILNAKTKIERSQIEAMLELLASVHGQFWDSPRLKQEFTWLRTPKEWIRDVEGPIAYKQRSIVGIERSGSVVSALLASKPDEIYRAFLASMSVSSRGPLTYLHGDPHVGNYYVTGDGRTGVLDWQVCFRGGWGHDFAYTMLSALVVQDRRNWERDLLSFYLGRLKHHGASSAPTFDEAWTLYRQQTLYTFVGWLYTIGFGPLQPNMQPDELCLKVIERSAAAVEDLESLQALSR
ncbi:MAG: phosphotransferase [Steroidobacteraceae bacterium]